MKQHFNIRIPVTLLVVTFMVFSAGCKIFQKKPSTDTTAPQTQVDNSGELRDEIKDEKGYRNGMVVSAHPVASEVGVAILKKGGNAVDAAVAVQFALAVVYPNAGNLGGGGFLVYRSARGEVASLDFREKAPGEAFRDMYLDMHGEPIVDLSLRSQLASGVPGSVDGMVKAHQKYGKLSWKELLQPSVDLARKGFALTAM